jgi:hypothetical protein
MVFSKTFPRNIRGVSSPSWEEVFLTEKEELDEEQKSKADGIKTMKECLKDADKIIIDMGLQRFQSNVVNIALALFEKRASHTVHYKEGRAKDKFDKLFSGKN